MNALNAVLLKLTGAILAPFSSMPAQVALIVISAVAGVLAAIAFRYTSNQKALKRVADQIRASMLAMRLFKDDVRSMFGAQFGLLKASGLRLFHSLPPLVVLIIPFVLLLAQLGMWYEFKPLQPGDKNVLEVAITPAAWQQYKSLQAEPVEGIELIGPIPNEHDKTLRWGVRPQAVSGDGVVTLKLKLGEQVVAEKQLVVSTDDAANRLRFISPVRAGTNFWDRLLYPAEPAFENGGPIERIDIDLDSRSNTIFGWGIPWWLTFFIVSILAALALKPVIKVQF